jgi:hypothetical protein
LFLSNYDSNWIGYLNNFINKASIGINGIWSNTVGFPQTKFLVFKGARNEKDFKSFAENNQTPARVWYSAYPDLTVQDIDKHSAVREELVATLEDEATRKWLRLF